MKFCNTRNFWLLIALLFLAIAAKAHAVSDDVIFWLAVLCTICGAIHAFAQTPEQITLKKLIALVEPPK